MEFMYSIDILSTKLMTDLFTHQIKAPTLNRQNQRVMYLHHVVFQAASLYKGVLLKNEFLL